MHKINIPDNVYEMMTALSTRGHTCVVIGGAVRDSLIREFYEIGHLPCAKDIVPKDWDLFTSATGKDILSIFPQGKIIGGEERQAKILTVVVDGVEISQYRSNGERTEVGSSLSEHLATCDFTINSLACDNTGTVLDAHGGIEDLRRGVIRFTGNPHKRLDEDKLRAMRGIRLLSKYSHLLGGWVLHLPSASAICDCDIMDLPAERLWDELLKIAIWPKGLVNLHDCGLLRRLFPYIKKLEFMDGGKYHDEAVLKHMFNTHRHLTSITHNPILCLTGFLHDIGKAETAEIGEDGEIHFYQHHKVGSDWLQHNLPPRFRCSKEEVEYMATLTYLHMHGEYSGSKVTSRTTRKILRELKEKDIALLDLIALRWADHQGNEAKERVAYHDFVTYNKLYLNAIKNLAAPNMVFGIKDLTVSGKDVMRVCELHPCREVGNRLRYLFELVDSGMVVNNRAALLEILIEINKKAADHPYQQWNRSQENGSTST